LHVYDTHKVVVIILITICMLAAGSGSRVLTVPGFVYGNHWFLTPPHKFDLPCPITKKLLQVVTSKTATPKPNVGANPPIGGFWANAW